MRDVATIAPPEIPATNAAMPHGSVAAASLHSAPLRAWNWQSVTRRAGAVGIAGGGVAAAWITQNLLYAGVALVLVIALFVLLPIAVSMLVSATSTNEQRQWAAASTLHMVFAFITANVQKKAKLVPTMEVPGRPTARPTQPAPKSRPVNVRRNRPSRHRHRRVAGR